VKLAYTIREATLADSEALVRHRLGMFTDMGVAFDPAALGDAFRRWLADAMPGGTYRAWVIEDQHAVIVGGGGASVLPWPPSPSDTGGRLAFVYNVYIDGPHRRRGLARRIMEAIHAFCRRDGIASVALNASVDGAPLYRTLGYVEAPAPMMFFAVGSDEQV
jgi:GNAT superfamily N-acetyltransferase